MPEEVPLKVANQILFAGKATRLMAQTSRQLPLPALGSQQVSVAGLWHCTARLSLPDDSERLWTAP